MYCTGTSSASAERNSKRLEIVYVTRNPRQYLPWIRHVINHYPESDSFWSRWQGSLSRLSAGAYKKTERSGKHPVLALTMS